MLRPLLLTAVSLLLAVSLTAQKSNNADKVTFSNGTTEMVNLQRGAGQYIGKTIGLRRSTDEPYRKFTPDLIDEFTIGRSQRTYRAVDVDVQAANIGGVSVRKRRFGEVLIDGQVQLIKVNLAGNEYNYSAIGMEGYSYLLREGDVELALELTTIMVYELLNANPSRFRNKLKFFVRDCPDAYDYAVKARFTDGDIMRVINDYATCKQLDDLQMNVQQISGRMQLSHFARLSNLDIRDKNYSNRQLSVAIGYQGEASFTNRMRWMGVLLSAEYVYQSFRWEDLSNVQQSMVKTNLSLAFKPYQRNDFSVQITGGLSSYNATSSSFQSFFANNYFLLSTGVRVRSHRYLFAVNYENMPNQIKEQPGNILQLSVGYRIAGW
ncbi:MAG: hypothetical protein ACJAZ9_002129 [Neolewinella sp.]|jgi:hypothetical protein